MNRTIIKLTLMAVGLLISGNIFAQQKLTKVSQSIKTDKDVTIDLSTSHCNIIFDTWNKGTVEIEAYIEGDNLSDEEMQEALKSWNVDVKGSQNEVSIKTKGHSSSLWVHRSHGNDENLKAVLKELKYELADLKDIDFDFHFEMAELPELPELPEMPELPELPEGINNFHFDYKSYKKDGDKYIEEYTKNFEQKFGKDYAKKMEAWGEKFGKEWGERLAERIEREAERTEEQQRRIEKIHEARVKALEDRERAREKVIVERQKHAEKREKLARERKVLIEKLVNKKSNSKVKKTIIIKMPKDAKLKVNVRHGEIEFAANIDNLKADLSHTKFIAHSINGSHTSINASYSPVYVTHWNLGELNLKYVESVELNNVKQLVLNSNSSNTLIQNLLGSAIIDGSIGDLKILKIDDSFSNLNVILQNTDAVIKLPKVNYNFQYKGTRTRFKHPEKPNDDNISSLTINNTETNKNIVVNAKFSNVVME